MTSQTKIFFFISALLILSVPTFMRNSLWHSELAIWTDSSIKSPLKARPYNGIGMIHSQSGQRGLAIKAFTKAIEVQAHFYVAQNNLGAEMFRIGNYSEAIKQFKVALNYEYYYPDGHNNLGSAYALTGELDKAIEEFKTAYKQNPHFVDAMLNLSRAYILKGSKAEARGLLSKVLSLYPDHKDAKILIKQL